MLILGLKGLSARDHQLLLEHFLKYVKNLSFSQPVQKISKKDKKYKKSSFSPFVPLELTLQYCIRCPLSVCINYKYTYHTM